MERFTRGDGPETPTHRRRTVLRGIAGALTLTAVRPAQAGGRTRYVVTAAGEAVADRIADAGFTVTTTLAGGTVYGVLGPADGRDELEGVDGVASAARDHVFEYEGSSLSAGSAHEDASFSGLQWDKQAFTTNALGAHERATGAGTKIAVVDSGVQADHPDLAPNVVTDEWRVFEEGTVSAGDHADVNGHGTHVAGIAVAAGEVGVVGTAPDADLVSLRVLDSNLNGAAVDILAAIGYAADVGADAVNLSLGTPPLPPSANATFRSAFERVVNDATRRGTVVVNSIGNEATDLQGRPTVFPGDAAGAMAVSATGPNDERAFYSNYGRDTVAVGAPGGGYETPAKTFADDTEWPFPSNLVWSTYPSDGYSYRGGTSMAAPQVAGTVGLVRELRPNANARRVQQAIEQGADLVPGKGDPDLGAGRLNCVGALDAPVLNGAGRGRR